MYFFNCSRNCNCESNPIYEKKITPEIARLRKKKKSGNLFSALYFEKRKKTPKFTSKLRLSLNVEPEVLRLKEKNDIIC